MGFFRDVKSIHRVLRDIRAQIMLQSFQLSELHRWFRIHADTKYADEKGLMKHGYKAFSQADEDGIISEIFHRIGSRDRYFVEIGVEDGIENNTLNLLHAGWRGLWVEASEEHVNSIRHRFDPLVASGHLSVASAFISAENITEVLSAATVPAEFDLLSIDIDGNDYWVWEALTGYSPRVVVIEYNAVLPVSLSWVMRYDPAFRWDGTSYYGASLKALEKLGQSKGYALVGCNFTGVNAFFVREDLVRDRFLAPYTAETHYEPPRYNYMFLKGGHPRGFGAYESP